jgi:hypothetical protein
MSFGQISYTVHEVLHVLKGPQQTPLEHNLLNV